uniref:Uncharacterized protein n=1 Tax=Anguilla anguilla TaxID=7936 RepID=A0A0E9RVJ1_ANGAN
MDRGNPILGQPSYADMRYASQDSALSRFTKHGPLV